MEILNEFCGETFFIWDGHNIGWCFRQIFLICPAYLLLLVSSCYFIGFPFVHVSLRTKFERFIIISRTFISLLLSLIAFFQIYKIFSVKTEKELSAAEIVPLVLKCITWAFHALYCKGLLNGITYRIRGPQLITFSNIICCALTASDFYFSGRDSHLGNVYFFSLADLVLQLTYIVTFLPSNSQRNEHIWARTLNSDLEEQEPLMHSVLSRYYGFSAETDSQDLGAAEEPSNILSKILFLWVHSLMLKGFNKNLKIIDDLYDLPPSLQSVNLSEKFFSQRIISDEAEQENYIKLCCGLFRIETLPLVSQLHRMFAFEFYSIGILKFICDISSFGGPLLLNALVSFLESDEESHSKLGYYYALGLFLVTFIYAIFSVQYNYFINKICLKVKASVMMLVYRKTLNLSKASLSGMSTGEIINFISTDADRIVNFCFSFHQFWSLPLQVIIALVLLYQQLHYCFIIGVVFMIIIIP